MILNALKGLQNALKKYRKMQVPTLAVCGMVENFQNFGLNIAVPHPVPQVPSSAYFPPSPGYFCRVCCGVTTHTYGNAENVGTLYVLQIFKKIQAIHFC